MYYAKKKPVKPESMKKVLILIPCYNEENRFPKQVFHDFLLDSANTKVYFLFINDGSTDNTSVIVSELSNDFEKCSFISLERNVGKAEAIRAGMLSQQSKDFDYVGYFDADLAAPLSQIELLKLSIKQHEMPLMILGARISLLGSTQINRKRSRHYIGRIFATIVSNMLRLPIYDTQCGAKLIRKDLIPIVFKEKFISKWLFDVEILFRIKNNFNDAKSKIVEVPLKKWEDVDGSKIGIFYFLRAPFDLLRIYFKYK